MHSTPTSATSLTVPSTAPSVPAIDESLFANLAELDRLLESAGDFDQEADEVFLGTTENNRRKDCRQPFLAELVVVVVAPPNELHQTFQFVRGWTQNLSPGGVGFVVSQQLPPGRHMMLIRHPDYPGLKNFFIGTILWEQQSGSEWEYGAAIRPSFSIHDELDFLDGTSS